MDKALALFLVLTLAFSAIASPEAASRLQVVNENATELVLEYEMPDFTTLTSEESLEHFYEADNGLSLPIVSRFVAVPVGYRAEIEISDRSSYALNMDEAAYDLVENLHLSIDTRQLIGKSDINSLSLYPPQAANVGKVEVWRGIPITSFNIYPLQIDHNNQTVIENEKLEVRIRFVADDTVPVPNSINDVRSSSVRGVIDRLLINAPHRDQLVTQSDYFDHILILHQNDEQFQERGIPWVDTLAYWKRQMGYRVSVEAIDDLRPLTIRNLIRNQYYFEHDHPISHLIIIGADSVQQQIFFPTYNQQTQTGDHYYALMDGDDVYLPDITVGRIHVHSYQELQGAITRTVKYEREPYTENGTEWFSRATFTAENIAAPGGQFVPSMLHLARWTRLKLLQSGFTRVDTIIATQISDGEVLTQTRTALAEGRTLAISRGWLAGSMSGGPASTGRKNPVTLAVTCLSHDTQSTFFRSVSRNNPFGPVAAMAITGLSHTKTNNSLIGGAVRAIRYFNTYEIGLLQNLGKVQLWSDNRFELAEYVETTLGYYRLMGDPTVKLFTAAPFQLTAEHPEQITPNTTALDVLVQGEGDVHGAWVTVQQSNGFHYVALADADGWARFTFENGELEEGELSITVTKHNTIPYISTLNVASANAMLDITQISFNNQDGLFGNGRVIPTTLTLHASGNAALSNINLTISTEDPWVSFSTNEIAVGAIGAGQTTTARFDLQSHHASKAGRAVRIRIVATAQQGEWNHAFNFQTSGPLMQLMQISGVPNDAVRGQEYPLVPQIRNIGDLSSPACNARLESLSEPWVTVTQAQSRYNAIDPNGSASPQDQFIINLNELFITGRTIPFNLILTAQEGNNQFSDTVRIEYRLGSPNVTDPTGPDSYGYLAFDSFDQDWEKAPEYNWVEINPNLEGFDYQGDRLEIRDYAVDLDTTVILNLPFTFSYYGQEFDEMVVNSNGWVAFGADQAQFPDFRTQQIPGIQGPDAQIAVYWMDLLNTYPNRSGIFTYYLEQQGIYIIEWSEVQIYTSREAPPDINLVSFQLLLYDPALWPTSTGDGEILMQYKHILHIEGDPWDNHYFTVGLKNLDGSDGLLYAYWDQFDPNSRRLEDGMSVLFTTDRVTAQGVLEGRAVQYENQDTGIEGVTIVMEQSRATATTDAEGYFRLERLPAGNDFAIFSKRGYNNSRLPVSIHEEEPANVVAMMTHPTIVMSNRPMERNVKPGDFGAPFNRSLRNQGNGPLEFRVSPRYEDGSNTTYARLDSFNISSLSDADRNIFGCEFIGDLLYVSGGKDRGFEDDNTIYVINRDGELVRSFLQPTQTVNGFRDLAYDGELLWGGERINDNTVRLVGIDLEGNIQSELNVAIPHNLLSEPYGLAWNPVVETFLTGYLTSDVFEINRQGEVIDRHPLRLPGGEVSIRGLAWNSSDLSGYQLYILDSQGGMRLSKVNVSTGQLMVVKQLPNAQSYVGTGLALGFDWQQSVVTLAVIDGGPNARTDDDLLYVFEIGPDVHFLRLAYDQNVVEAGGVGYILGEMRGEGLRHGQQFRFSLLVEHNASSASVIVPFILDVDDDAGVELEEELTPVEFALNAAYPNPFNQTTLITFSIPDNAKTSVKIYDLAGRQVASLIDDNISAGIHQLIFEARDLASGIYFCKLETGKQRAVQRIVLLR